jgi:hypothetical protein
MLFDPDTEGSRESAAGVSRTCATCGAELKPEYRYCTSCGTLRASAGFYCPRCGYRVEAVHRFCTNCGADVSGVTGLTRPPVGGYPLRFDVEYPRRLSRLLIFVKLLVAIPQLLVVYALTTIAGVVTFLCWFSILFTASYPRGLFELVVSFNRWSANVFAYVTLMRDEYPPFSGEPGRYAVTYEADHPYRLRRELLFFKWLFAIPHQVALYLLGVLAVLLVLPIAWLSILVMGRYPRPLFRYMRGLMRWYWRVNAYSSLMRDEFPPFSMAAVSRQQMASKVLYSFGVIVAAFTLLGLTLAATFSVVEPRTETVTVDYLDLLAGERTETVSIEGTEVALLAIDDPYTGGRPADEEERYVAFTLRVRNRDSLFTSVSESAFEVRGAFESGYSPEYVILPDTPGRGSVLEKGESARVIVVFSMFSFEDPASLTYSPGLAVILPFGERVRFEFR